MDKTYEISWIYNPEPINYFYVENISGSRQRFNFFTAVSEENIPNLYYKIGENGTWKKENHVLHTSIYLENGQRVYFRNDTGYWGGPWDPTLQTKEYYGISFPFNHKIGGDIRTLLNYKNLPTTSHPYEFKGFWNSSQSYLIDSSDLDLNGFDTIAEGTFSMFFANCSYMTNTISNLKYTNVPDKCYNSMFKGCIRLVVPPSIDANTAGANYSMSTMFDNCRSLTKVPKIKITEFNDTFKFPSMFYNCTQLKVSETPVEGFNYTFRLPDEGTGSGTNTFSLYDVNESMVKIKVNQTYYCNFDSI